MIQYLVIIKRAIHPFKDRQRMDWIVRELKVMAFPARYTTVVRLHSEIPPASFFNGNRSDREQGGQLIITQITCWVSSELSSFVQCRQHNCTYAMIPAALSLASKALKSANSPGTSVAALFACVAA
ncbi:hypothetical protein D3C75_1042760 [compost metagenome]